MLLSLFVYFCILSYTIIIIRLVGFCNIFFVIFCQKMQFFTLLFKNIQSPSELPFHAVCAAVYNLSTLFF